MAVNPNMYFFAPTQKCSASLRFIFRRVYRTAKCIPSSNPPPTCELLHERVVGLRGRGSRRRAVLWAHGGVFGTASSCFVTDALPAGSPSRCPAHLARLLLPLPLPLPSRYPSPSPARQPTLPTWHPCCSSSPCTSLPTPPTRPLAHAHQPAHLGPLPCPFALLHIHPLSTPRDPPTLPTLAPFPSPSCTSVPYPRPSTHPPCPPWPLPPRPPARPQRWAAWVRPAPRTPW